MGSVVAEFDSVACAARTARRLGAERSDAMQLLTGTTTVNAAFLQEIKDDHHELRNLLGHTAELLAAPHHAPADLRRLVELLGSLRDRLAMHFSLEESFGYFDDALNAAPRLSRRAETLRSEHQPLFLDLCAVVERAEKLLYHETPGHALRPVSAAFAAFDDRLGRHEQAERAMIMDALVDDIGVGD